jgi:arsenite-transporting ATPase
VDVASFLSASDVLVVAGKGGVGKTTVAATLALAGAGSGLRVLVVELEGKQGLPAAFGRGADPLEYEPRRLWPSSDLDDETQDTGEVRGRLLTPDAALADYLEAHGLTRALRRLLSSGTLDVVATAVPGLRDVLVLGKVKSMVRDGDADVIIVDAPAAGHAVSFLTSASGLKEAFRSGPVRQQAEEVADLIADARALRVLLVTLAEEEPVNELLETAGTLRERTGVTLAPVVVNQVSTFTLDPLPDVAVGELARQSGETIDPSEADELERTRQFWARRAKLERMELDRLERELGRRPTSLPRLERPTIGLEETAMLAQALCEAVVTE